jgi:SAM-dependent methyltransferase
MQFWRIYDNQLYDLGNVERLGFPSIDPSYIPDEYLEQKTFVVMRTSFGIGDWGVITAMPRLLKTKYPDCKVYIPSKKLLQSLFGSIQTNWSVWEDPFANVSNVFKNNPWVDGEVDSVTGDIFHDHYRIYDEKNIDVPVLEQILKFWQFTDDECADSAPEIYFDDNEIELGNEIIKRHVGDNEFGCLLLSERYKYESDKILIDVLKQHDLPYFYWTKDPIEMTSFNFIKKALNLRNIDTRIQLYIKSKAKINIGNQAGINHIINRYSNVIELQRQVPLAHNFVKGETYIIDIDKHRLLKDVPDKWESKTTTSLKFKSELIDFFNKDMYKNMSVLEIGSSTGYTTKILSFLFKQVTAVDILPERHEYSKTNVNNLNNNIKYVIADVYNNQWQFEHHDVVLIDCIHDYEHVKLDIQNSINHFKTPILVFDDYGLFPDIKQAIDEYIDSGKLEILAYIGHAPNTVIPKTKNKILKHYEGLICQAK